RLREHREHRPRVVNDLALTVECVRNEQVGPLARYLDGPLPFVVGELNERGDQRGQSRDAGEEKAPNQAPGMQPPECGLAGHGLTNPSSIAPCASRVSSGPWVLAMRRPFR